MEFQLEGPSCPKCPRPLSCCAACCSPSGRLRNANAVAFLLHASLVTVTILVSNMDLHVAVYSPRFVVYGSEDSWGLSPSGNEEVGRLYVAYLVVAFFALSAVFHLGNALLWGRWYAAGIRRCICPTRWVEYAFSASVMQILISYLAGFVFLTDIVFIFALSSLLMSFGYLQERLNRPALVGDAWQHPFPQRAVPHLLGWVPFLVLWFSYFYRFYRLPKVTPDGAEMPVFVYAIVWSQLFLSLPFALVQLYQVASPPSRYARGEFAFILLSFASKATLGIILLVNVLSVA